VDQVLQDLRKQRESKRTFGFFMAVLAGAATIPIYFLLRRALIPLMPALFAKSIAWCVVVGLMLAPALWSIRRRAPKLLRKRLLASGVPVCLKCGYILRGCPGPNCPECGGPFDERVRLILAGRSSPTAPQT
jgi:hypothetical protein